MLVSTRPNILIYGIWLSVRLVHKLIIVWIVFGVFDTTYSPWKR